MEKIFVSSFTSSSPRPPPHELCCLLHTQCTIPFGCAGPASKIRIPKKNSRTDRDSWRQDTKKSLREAARTERDFVASTVRCGCQASLGLTHLWWIAAAKSFGFTTLHQLLRHNLYASPPITTNNSSDDGENKSAFLSSCSSSFLHHIPRNSADHLPLQKLAHWSADQGIFIHPGVEFIPGATEYRDFRMRAKPDALLPYLTPLLVVPVSCLLGFGDAHDEAESRDMLKGTAIAAGVAVHADLSNNRNDKVQQAKTTSAGDDNDDDGNDKLSDAAADVCKFFFDSLGLVVNDLLVASNNEATDTRHALASILLSGTRTLKNAPYLSDRDFAVVGASCPIAEAFRHMVHNFVDNGPLSMKVERPLLQSAVSVALSHSMILPMHVKRSVDNYGNVIRGSSSAMMRNMDDMGAGAGDVGGGDRIEAAPGGIGSVPWLHMLPHGGDTLNAVAIVATAEESAAYAEWVADQVPCSGATSPFSRRVLRNGFVVLVACEDIGPCEEVCAQTMAPLNPTTVASSSSNSASSSSSSGRKDNKQSDNKAQDDDDDDDYEKREAMLAEQYELDKEYDETVAMWMVTTASAPPQPAVPSSEARFIQGCIVDAVAEEVKRRNDES